MKETIDQIVDQALAEDVVAKDITSLAVFGNGGATKEGVLLAKQDLVLSGLEIATKVFKKVSSKTSVIGYFRDGSFVQKGRKIATVRGFVSDLLRAERVALNFLQHLSGVATLTKAFVDAIRPYRCRILDTRKTIPGLRALQKKAVKDGGGENHRMNLSDQYLIKDNHITACGGIVEAIRKVKQGAGGRFNPNQRHRRGEGEASWALPMEGATRAPLIEVEAKDLREVRQAVEEGVDIILLDNMSVTQIKKAVQLVEGKCLLEVSGGVNLKNVQKIAQTGVARISIGALTHSAPAVDISLEIL